MTIGRGLWWAAQTVTTVGYGNAVPQSTAGRALALVVMVCAIAFLSVVTAAITAALIDGQRRGLARLEQTTTTTIWRIPSQLQPSHMKRLRGSLWPFSTST